MSGPIPVVRRPQGNGAAAAKAAAFTLLGGLLAVGILAIVAPGGLAALFGDKPAPADAGEADVPKADAKRSAPDRTPAKASHEPPPAADSGQVPSASAGEAKAPDEDEPTVVDDESGEGEEVIEVAPPSIESMAADELVALGDELAGSKAWLEPADRNLALVVSKLAIVDPGNEAVSKLRQAAADELLPAAQAALAKRRWAGAAAAFRALHQIWPTHPEAREGLIESLEGEAKVLSSRKYNDHGGALAAVNELLVMQPNDADVLEQQGDLLDELGRYAEARDAYKAARQQNARSKDLFKKYLKAVRKARKADKADN
jgi:tetratricopeptide (TPR) repeat protein